jgi:hypothetical protein
MTARPRYQVRPLSSRHWIQSGPSETSRFTSTWSNTLDLLLREIDFLDGHSIAIGVDATEEDFKLNGELRARARLRSPAVEIAFESKYGPLIYQSAQYVGTPYNNKMELWQHNVRAVALTLEAARAMDRYGATRTGQQYVGFKAIGSGQASEPDVPVFTQQEAADYLRSEEVTGILGGEGLSLKSAYRLAARRFHPDAGGDAGMWAKIDAARATLKRAGVDL